MSYTRSKSIYVGCSRMKVACHATDLCFSYLSFFPTHHLSECLIWDTNYLHTAVTTTYMYIYLHGWGSPSNILTPSPVPQWGLEYNLSPTRKKEFIKDQRDSEMTFKDPLPPSLFPFRFPRSHAGGYIICKWRSNPLWLRWSQWQCTGLWCLAMFCRMIVQKLFVPACLHKTHVWNYHIPIKPHIQ